MGPVSSRRVLPEDRHWYCRDRAGVGCARTRSCRRDCYLLALDPGPAARQHTENLQDRLLSAASAFAKAQAEGRLEEASLWALRAGELERTLHRESVQRGIALGEIPRPAPPAMSSGRKRGGLDPLDRVLMEMLSVDPYIQAPTVKTRLRKRAESGDRVVVEVRRGAIAAPPIPRARRVLRSRMDDIVIWVHPKTGQRKRTAWSSICARRLPRLRKLVRPTK